LAFNQLVARSSRARPTIFFFNLQKRVFSSSLRQSWLNIYESAIGIIG
jgi:hypothetical protein